MLEKQPAVWLQAVTSRPRLIISLLIGLAAYVISTRWFSLTPLECGLLAWDLAITCYLLLVIRLMRGANPEDMHRRALDQDAGRKTVLTLVVASVVISFSGIMIELVEAKTMFNELKTGHILIALTTVVLCWLFAHIMFAQHFAHEFYEAVLQGRPGGLEFPGESAPNYTDFIYFAFAIGTSAQTSDVSVTSRPMRRLVVVHSMFSFAYNTALIALGINIASSLF